MGCVVVLLVACDKDWVVELSMLALVTALLFSLEIGAISCVEGMLPEYAMTATPEVVPQPPLQGSAAVGGGLELR